MLKLIIKIFENMNDYNLCKVKFVKFKINLFNKNLKNIISFLNKTCNLENLLIWKIFNILKVESFFEWILDSF